MIIFVLAAASAVVLTRLYIDLVAEPRMAEHFEKMKKHLPAIIEDLKLLERNPPFPATSRARNAEFLLSQWVPWEGAREKQYSNPTMTKLFDKYHQWNRDDAQLKALARSREFAQIDADWMDALVDYDHWDLAAYPEIKDGLNTAAGLNGLGRTGVTASLPVPNYSMLRQWALVYFLKQTKNGDASRGLKMYHHAAELAHSSGTLVGSMIAAAMLKDEDRLAYMYKLKHRPADEQALEAYRRANWAWAGVMFLSWHGGGMEMMKPYMKRETGLCAGVWEGLLGVSGLQDFLEPSVPFEPNYTEHYRAARETLGAGIEACAMKAYRPLLEKTAAGADPWFTSNVVAGINPSHIPFLRRVVGLHLAGIALPNYLGLYERRN
jgi:hypothetical protein